MPNQKQSAWKNPASLTYLGGFFVWQEDVKVREDVLSCALVDRRIRVGYDRSQSYDGQ
jgi:hypothetical protein